MKSRTLFPSSYRDMVHAHYLWKSCQKGLTQNNPHIAAQLGIKTRNVVLCLLEDSVAE